MHEYSVVSELVSALLFHGVAYSDAISAHKVHKYLTTGPGCARVSYSIEKGVVAMKRRVKARRAVLTVLPEYHSNNNPSLFSLLNPNAPCGANN